MPSAFFLDALFSRAYKHKKLYKNYKKTILLKYDFRIYAMYRCICLCLIHIFRDKRRFTLLF